MKCNNCGAEFPDNGQFCPKCGTPRSNNPQPDFGQQPNQQPGQQQGQQPNQQQPNQQQFNQQQNYQQNYQQGYQQQGGNYQYAGSGAGVGTAITERNIGLCILLSIITCGIYWLIWLYKVAQELNALYGKEDETPAMVLVYSIFSCGIYLIFWAYKSSEKVNEIRVRRGEAKNDLFCLLFPIFAFSPAVLGLIQDELNKNATVKASL